MTTTSTPAARARRFKLAPLGALAAGFGLGLTQGLASAQAVAPAAAASAATPAPSDTAPTLPPVTAKAEAERQGKDAYQATRSRIGKGEQDLRDIPQSITVVTEKLMDDRHLDTMKDVLRNTAGITFQAAEGGEEDIRLRGFALQTTGDVFIDGMRDPAFYDRDTFFLDRIELLRGSAGLLFGRGSTGGAVNQVTKSPYLLTENQVDVSVGSGSYARAVGDFNLRLGASSAMRVGTMITKADNNGAGTSLDKQGIALAVRTGIGERHEFAATLYYLNNDNGINYGIPYAYRTRAEAARAAALPVAGRPAASQVLPLDPDAYYGLASDRNDGSAGILSLSHTWRLQPGQEIVTKIRHGDYTRDQRATTVRFATPTALQDVSPATVFTRGFQPKVQDADVTIVQSDYSGAFKWFGMQHELQAGIDATRERKQVYQPITAAQGGVVPPKPTTTVATPNDGATVDESLRSFRLGNEYESRAGGVYVQDLIEFLPKWKLLAGLRYDYLAGDYDSYAISGAATRYNMDISAVSRRLALLFQPSDRLSFHVSSATSFNTSGDAYSLSAQNENTPPEKSINLEFGARANSADGNFTARAAIFRTTKLHERNTDPLVDLTTLSGKRHATGLELDLTGRITPNWEVFGSYAWIPDAKVDVAVVGSEPQGARTSLTPMHSGTIWSTYQFTPSLRAGAGLNARSKVSPVGAAEPFNVPSYVTGDLMAEFTANDKLTYKLNVTNVTDKLYADAVYRGHYVPGPGRTILVTGSFKF